MKKWWLWLLVVLLILGSFFSGYIVRGKFIKPDIQIDTITVVDSFPVYKTEIVYKDKPIYVYVDTGKVITRHDSVYLALPTVKRIYEGDYYKLAVSGVNPTLEYIQQKVPQSTVKPKYNSVFMDLNISYAKQFSMPLTLNYEYERDFYGFYGGAGYDFLQKSVIIQIGAEVKFGKW